LRPAFFPLFGPRVTGQEAGLLQVLTELGHHLDQRTGDSEPHGARLPAGSAAGHGRVNIEGTERAGDLERRLDQLLLHLIEGDVEPTLVLLVQLELTGTRDQPDTNDRLFAATDGLDWLGRRRNYAEQRAWSSSRREWWSLR